MNRFAPRTFAAVLAVVVTLAGLKGIALLAQIDRPARTSVAVLPSVEITAPAPVRLPNVAANKKPVDGAM